MGRRWWQQLTDGVRRRPTPTEAGRAGASAWARFQDLAGQAGAAVGRDRREIIVEQLVVGVVWALALAAVGATLVQGVLAWMSEPDAVRVGGLVGLVGLLAIGAATQNPITGAAIGLFLGALVWALDGQPVLAVVAGGLLPAAAVAWRWRARLAELDAEVPRSVRVWQWGAEGERKTAALLQPLLDEDWRAVHDRACPGSTANIDHLVVGPTGIFVIDSKQWRAGQVSTDGRQGRVLLDEEARRVDGVVEQVRAVAERLADVLVATDTTMAAVVAVHDATVPAGGLEAGHAHVVGADELTGWLRRHATGELDPGEATMVMRMARRRLQPAG